MNDTTVFDESILSGGVFESQVDNTTVGTTAQPQPPILMQRWKLGGVRTAKATRPPIHYIVPGLIACPSVNMLFGPPSAKKTMLLADLMTALVSGTKWLPVQGSWGGVDFDTNLATVDPDGAINYHGGVMLIDGDTGPARTSERLEAFIKTRKVQDEAPLFYESMPEPWLDLSNGRSVQSLTDLLRHLCVKFLVLDNLGVFSGEIEESSSQMRGVMRNIRTMAEDAQCAIILVHHATKSKSADRVGDLSRGHGSIEAGLDLSFMAECEGPNEPVNVTAAKVRSYVKATEFGAFLRYTHKPGTTELSTAYFSAHRAESKLDRDRKLVKDIYVNLGLDDIEAAAKIIKRRLAVLDISMTLDKIAGLLMGY